MPPVGFEPTIPAIGRFEAFALDRVTQPNILLKNVGHLLRLNLGYHLEEQPVAFLQHWSHIYTVIYRETNRVNRYRDSVLS
jgi:hypothetical protein